MHTPSGYQPIDRDSFSLEANRVVHKFPDGDTFAFEFKGAEGEAYAELLRDRSHQLQWVHFRKGEGDRRYRMLTKLEKEAAIAHGRANAIEKKMEEKQHELDAKQVDPRSAAYQRFSEAYGSRVPKNPINTSNVLAHLGIPANQRGNRAMIHPEDPKRPAVLISAGREEYQDVDGTVAELRNATTAAILVRRGLWGASRKNLEMRANSIIIAKPGKQFTDGIDQANEQLGSLAHYVAVGSVTTAREKTGSGPFGDASWRVERAARGGIGRRRFNMGIAEGQGEAMSSINESIDKVSQVVAERAREFAFTSASEVAKRADEVGKPGRFVGYEVDFENRRPTGVDYSIQTTDGRTYTIRNLGKNYQDPEGEFVPARAYGQFNVNMLMLYESEKGISPDKLYEQSFLYSFVPTQDGEIHYLDPEKYSRAERDSILSSLKSQYEKRGFLTQRDLSAAMSVRGIAKGGKDASPISNLQTGKRG